jgi:hypothetical protein
MEALGYVPPRENALGSLALVLTTRALALTSSALALDPCSLPLIRAETRDRVVPDSSSLARTPEGIDQPVHDLRVALQDRGVRAEQFRTIEVGESVPA